MKIMKMWRNTTLFAYFRFMGYVMMIVGIYLIVNGIGDYAGQSRQKDWIPIEATVTDVSSEVVSSSPGRHGSNSSTYTAVDSTEDIRQSWGIGSMLIRSVSVHEDSLRLDYCRLDSADACYRFYAAATLPITGEVTESNTFTGQVYAVDSPTNFAAKIRSGQIMLYVYTTQEGKADVLAFLEAAGWWSE